ncbi:MAG: apolipoprotein N-acyltransferase, partial [Bacteroidota bacterium]
VSMIFLPIIISYIIYYSYEEKNNPVKVVAVQPNIDPYSEKFSGMNFEMQIEKMFRLAKQKTDSTTDYLVFPETSLTEAIWENESRQTYSIRYIKRFLKQYPNLKVIIGANTLRSYSEGEKTSVTARKFKQQEGYYDVFNTIIQIDTTEKIQMYHKSKLVPGVERMPYPAVFGFLETFVIELGGTSGSMGTQEERTVFEDQTKPLIKNSIAPVICYESIFGEFVTKYIRNEASLIFIITNDGWWSNTDGYKQHLLYGRLRAIETRRSIARSGNTGISCFINQRGDILQPTQWWKEAVIKDNINSNTEKTFYVKYGDIIGRIAFYGSGIILLFAIGINFLIRKN